MKNDLDLLMEEKNLDAILVSGPAQNNPAMVYFTGIAHLTRADLIKKRGEDPVLYCMPMERDEAARTGLKTRLMDIPYLQELIRKLRGNSIQAHSLMLKKMLTDEGLDHGQVGVYGLVEAGPMFSLLNALQTNMPDIKIIGEVGKPVLLSAMETKNSDEIEHIRKIGRTATSIIGEVAELVTSHSVRDQILIKKDGTPLTVGDVKRKINLWLAEREAENPHGTIFAIGYDAGVPHSSGKTEDPLRLGQTIVFDFFPREAGGGYYYDITRTWCLGYATDEALRLYDDVLHVYQSVLSSLRLGASCQSYHLMACDLFEARGHPTQRTDPATTNGYVHKLGHGLGLHVHEQPWFNPDSPEEYYLTPGMVFTVEPGLYYPEKNLGMRLEDTILAKADGEFEPVVSYPLDLVLPMRG